jgi:predicted outer membrane repeat protein
VILLLPPPTHPNDFTSLCCQGSQTTNLFGVDLHFRVNLNKNPNARAAFDGTVLASKLFVTSQSNLSFTNIDFRRSRRSFLAQSSTLSFVNCRFVDNDSFESGGAVFAASNCSLTFRNCTFQNNSAAALGGAIAATDFVSIDISNSRFVDNRAPSAGAISLAMTTNTTQKLASVVNCTFISNKATTTGFGGAVLQNVRGLTTAITKLSRCTFESNGGLLGGAVLIDSSTVVFSDSSFAKNNAGEGGAMRIRGQSNVSSVFGCRIIFDRIVFRSYRRLML